MRSKLVVVIFAFVLFGMFACSSGIKLQFQKPGQISFAGIKRLAVAPCSGLVEAENLQIRLAAELKKCDYFYLYFEDDISDSFWDHKLSYAQIAEADSSELAQIGGWLNVDGMLFCDLKTLEMEFECAKQSL